MTDTTDTSASTAPTSNTEEILTRCVIYAKIGASQEAYAAFTSKLRRETNPETLWVESTEDQMIVGSWTQYLTAAQIEEFEKHPVVSVFLEVLTQSGMIQVSSISVPNGDMGYFIW